MGFGKGAFVLVDRYPASDHSSFGFVHAPLNIVDVSCLWLQLPNGSQESSPEPFVLREASRSPSLLTVVIHMRCAKHPVVRNKTDLTDANQVRAWRRRLGVSADDFKEAWPLEKLGASIQRLPR